MKSKTRQAQVSGTLDPIVRCRCTGEHGHIIFRFADNAHVKVLWFNGKVTHEPVSMIEEVSTPNS